MNFSIIIPVHNGQKYLQGTVDSVLRQLSGADFSAEILLVENASDDDSPSICDRYAAEHVNIRCFHEGRIGAYGARRLGMDKAEGDWLVFADADDELVDGGLKKLWDCASSFSDLESAPDIILYSWQELTSEGSSKKTYPFEPGKIYKGARKTAFYDIMCDGDSINAPWNKCIKRSLARKALSDGGVGFLNHGEDLLQTAQFLDLAESIMYLDETVYSYRSNNEGLSGSYHEEFFPCQITAWERFDAYADSWAEGTGKYRERIDARKSLTCAIGVKSLIYSKLKTGDIEKKLKGIMESDFYGKYASLALPEWAPEEDIFVHDLMTGDRPLEKLIASSKKHAVKRFIKERIRR